MRWEGGKVPEVTWFSQLTGFLDCMFHRSTFFIPVAVIFLDLLFQSLKTVLLYCFGISQAFFLHKVSIKLWRIIANDKNGEPRLTLPGSWPAGSQEWG